VIEQGKCAEDPVTGFYDYIATAEAASLAGVKITATARDHPGHTGELAVTLQGAVLFHFTCERDSGNGVLFFSWVIKVNEPLHS
jgi:hypothetical protein